MNYDGLDGNIRTWIERAETAIGEQVEAVVVGRHYGREWKEPQRPDENVILPREAALAKLDENFDAGFGGPDCYPVYAWTKSWVLFIHEYDGATALHKVPRHPQDCEPDFDGTNSEDDDD